jgi:hypothetical protein
MLVVRKNIKFDSKKVLPLISYLQTSEILFVKSRYPMTAANPKKLLVISPASPPFNEYTWSSVSNASSVLSTAASRKDPTLFGYV